MGRSAAVCSLEFLWVIQRRAAYFVTRYAKKFNLVCRALEINKGSRAVAFWAS